MKEEVTATERGQAKEGTRFWVFRVTAAFLTLVSVVFLAEAIYSLGWGHSLIRRVLGIETPIPRFGILDSEHRQAALLTAGSLVAHHDPWIGFAMKAGMKRTILGKQVTTDGLGLRARIGPGEDAKSPRVVILGDSVAFGFGVGDDETLGHALEAALLRRWPKDHGPAPIVRTVACPGWNFESEFRFLEQHLVELAPNLVIWVPVPNDLDDLTTVDEAGFRRFVNPAEGAVVPQRNVESFFLHSVHWLQHSESNLYLQVLSRGGVQSIAHAWITDVTKASVARWQNLVESTRKLDRRLRSAGARLLVSPYYAGPHEFMPLLMTKIADAVPDVLLAPVFEAPEETDTLKIDPHPNANFHSAVAEVLASKIGSLGLIPGVEPKPADIQSDLAARRCREGFLERARAFTEKWKPIWSKALESEINLASGLGFHQIYGGIDPDGVMGRSARVVLRLGPGKTLRLRYRTPAPDLRPLSLELRSDAFQVVKELPCTPGEAGTVEEVAIDLTPVDGKCQFLDLELRTSDARVRSRNGQSRLESLDFISLAIL